MQAKVKPDYFLPSLIAFSGVEFIKKEWRTVPEGLEAEAEAHPNLDVREDGDLEEEVSLDEIRLRGPDVGAGSARKYLDSVLEEEKPTEEFAPLEVVEVEGTTEETEVEPEKVEELQPSEEIRERTSRRR